MTNVTELCPDKDITKDPLRIAWSDEVFTIVKTVGRENRTISLTPEEEDYLYEKLTEKRQPWTPAS